MTNWLIKRFIPDWKNTSDQNVRMSYGKLASWVGILCNIFLCISKAIIGLLSGSIAIVADSANNLSDASSNIVTLLGFKMASKPADEKHPYGHGRYEYLSGLVVASIIVAVGANLSYSSFMRILHPEPTHFSDALVLVLLISIAVKFWMKSFNLKAGIAIDSTALKAAATDSRNDIITTTGILIAAFIDAFTPFNVDGLAGLAVGIYIVISGIELIGETLNPLLGQTPDPELVKHIKDTIMSYDYVIGTHDLMVHDYGPGRLFASAHVEMPAETDPLESHDVLDNIEEYFKTKEGLNIVLHYDPVVTGDSETAELRQHISDEIVKIHPELSIHDLRIVPGSTHTNVIFDCLKSQDLEMSDKELKDKLCSIVKDYKKDAVPKITIDKSYVSAQ